MSIVWACCSSGRPEMIKAKTLQTLANCGFTETLFICVPHEEMAAYSTALADRMVILVGAEKGLVKQRKHIRSMWPPGQEIVFIDDDIDRIKFLDNGKVHPVANIHALVDYFFQYIHHIEGPLMWGVYPVINKDWMKMRATHSNCFIVAAFFGIINDPRLEEPEEAEMDDWSRSLAEQKAGRPPVRFDWVGIDTKYFKNAGGLQQVRTMEKHTEMCKVLSAKYPEFVKMKHRSGRDDLRYINKTTFVERVLPETSVPAESVALSTQPAEGCEAFSGGDP